MNAEQQTARTTLEQYPPRPYGELVRQDDNATVERVLGSQQVHIDSLRWKMMADAPGTEIPACAFVTNGDPENVDYIVLLAKIPQQNGRPHWPEVKRTINIHAFTRSEWTAFVEGMKAGQLSEEDLTAPTHERRSIATSLKPADEAYISDLPIIIIDDEGMVRVEPRQTAKRRKEVALQVAQLGLPPVIEGYIESEVIEPDTPLIAEVSPSAQSPLQRRAGALALPSAQG